ncbi:MAG: hypothetical protein ACKO2P_03330 [Planctomycetota bacterium]
MSNTHPRSSVFSTARSRRRVSAGLVATVQLIVLGIAVPAWTLSAAADRTAVTSALLRQPWPLESLPDIPPPRPVPSLYDNPAVVSDEQLATVLRKLIPRFSQSQLRPNLIEHALRTWGSEIQFQAEDTISGPDLAAFLTDSAKHLQSWNHRVSPLLLDTGLGVHVRFSEDAAGSVHHDHALAALTEAGLPLNAPVFTTVRSLQLRDVLQEALRDFRPDERETEWSAMAFTLWLAGPEITGWHTAQGRHVTLDLLARRLIRSHKRGGVCLGTHRIYTMMLMLRLNREHSGKLLHPDTVTASTEYLADIRDRITASQWPDGSWNSNWVDGADCFRLTDPQEKASKRVIATGHHLEWLALAPEHLHPPQEQILKAAAWLVQNVSQTPQEDIDQNFTFYSHVGKALALWRKTTPAEFWTRWIELHPEATRLEPRIPTPGPADAVGH